MKGKKVLAIGGATLMAVSIIGTTAAFAGGNMHPRGGYGHGIKAEFMRVAADTLNIEASELMAELRSGKTLAEVAADNGVDIDTVIDALVDTADEKLDQAVENGRLTQEEADEKLDNIENRITEMVDKVLPMGGHHGKMRRAAHAVVNIAADQLGLEKSELVAELRDGKTISEVAAEQGVDTSSIVDAVVDAAEERLDRAVENGRLTQEEADERLDMIEEKVTEAMDKTWPTDRPSRWRGNRGFGPGGGDGFGPGTDSNFIPRGGNGFNSTNIPTNAL